MRRDFTGSGRGQLLVSSGWGMAVLGLQGTTLASAAIAQNGSALNAWRLDTQANHIGPTGRFDGSAVSSTFMTSGWGVGIVRGSGGKLVSTAMLPNGGHIQGPGGASFPIDTTACEFGPVGNFDGDQHDAILVKDGWGIATLKQSGSSLFAGTIVRFSTPLEPSTIGGWPLSETDRFGPVGDYDGNGQDEVLVINAEGIGIIRPSAQNPTTLCVAKNGGAIGSWTLDVTKDQFGPAADFDGDGKLEILVSNPGGFALLKCVNGALTSLAMKTSGNWIGGWHLGGADVLGPAADFNGDGRAELLITSGWGLAVLACTAAGWSASSVTANGTPAGQWRLDTVRNRMVMADDFDGDGRAELLMSSGWGMGLLDLSAAPVAKVVAANGSALGSWRLDTPNNDLEHGVARTEAMILYHSDWTDAVNDTTSVLTQRGTTVRSYSDTTLFTTALQNHAATAALGDKLFIYLGVHGDTGRQAGDVSRAPSLTHGMQATTGYFKLSAISPSFTSIARRGCDLIVVDGSCEGGETVFNAFGERYCAMATTGATDVGLTNDPDPGAQIKTESKPANFGVWWSPPHLVGSRLNGRILLDMAHSVRIGQRLYRNDNTAATQSMLFARPALDDLYALRSWWLDVGGCYLYPLLWPSEAANELASNASLAWTASAQSLLAFGTSMTAPQQATLAAYQSGVLDAAYDSSLASLYAANMTAIWQCMADDPSWNIATEPGKYAAAMGNIMPSSFSGTAGYTLLLNSAYAAFLTLQACYDKAASLIAAIDAAVRNSPTLGGRAPGANAVRLLIDMNADDPAVKALTTRHTQALRAMALRPAAQIPVEPIEAPPAQKPTLAQMQAQLDSRVALWTAAALTEPTGDATVDALAAQLMGTYAEHDSNAFAGSFLLAVVEDVMCAKQSSGLGVPGDLVRF